MPLAADWLAAARELVLQKPCENPIPAPFSRFFITSTPNYRLTGVASLCCALRFAVFKPSFGQAPTLEFTGLRDFCGSTVK
jgi:hypothetical protein